MNQQLNKVDLITVSDLYEKNYDNLFAADVVRAIKFERDNYVQKMKDFMDATIDPECCNIGPVNRYYKLLAAVERYEIYNYYTEPKKVRVTMLESNSFCIEGINNILSTFKLREFEYLKLWVCDKLTFKEIGNKYCVNSTICRSKVLQLLEKLYRFYKAYLPNDGKTVKIFAKEIADIPEKESMGVDCLKLDNKILNSLKRAGVVSINTLKEFAKNGKLKTIRGIGKKGYDKIIVALEQY